MYLIPQDIYKRVLDSISESELHTVNQYNKKADQNFTENQTLSDIEESPNESDEQTIDTQVSQNDISPAPQESIESTDQPLDEETKNELSDNQSIVNDDLNDSPLANLIPEETESETNKTLPEETTEPNEENELNEEDQTEPQEGYQSNYALWLENDSLKKDLKKCKTLLTKQTMKSIKGKTAKAKQEEIDDQPIVNQRKSTRIKKPNTKYQNNDYDQWLNDDDDIDMNDSSNQVKKAPKRIRNYQNIYNCKHCNEKFSNKDNLVKHMLLQHTQNYENNGPKKMKLDPLAPKFIKQKKLELKNI